MRLLGQAPADTVDGLCAYPVPLGPVSQDVFSGLAFLGLVLLICAAIVIVIIVVIIVVIVLLAKRPPTQPVYPYPPPLAGSPWALAPFPPPSPPPEPPQPPKFRGT